METAKIVTHSGTPWVYTCMWQARKQQIRFFLVMGLLLLRNKSAYLFSVDEPVTHLLGKLEEQERHLLDVWSITLTQQM